MTIPPEIERDAASRRAAAWADFFAEPDYPPPPATPAPSGARSGAALVARLVGEVLSGSRPAHQLDAWLDLVSRAQLRRWLARHPQLTVQLTGAQFTALGASRQSCLLRFQAGRRALFVLLEMVESGERWTCRSLEIGLPGPTPTGIMPRWGYDRDTA